jgi:hypothetical protein
MRTPFVSIPILLVISGATVVGCGHRYPKFEIGEQVQATVGDITHQGTVLQWTTGKDRDFPGDPYYEIDFGPLENGPHELNIVWFHAKYLRKVPTSQKKSEEVKRGYLQNESKD